MNNKNIIIGIRPIIESIKNDEIFDKILIKKGLKGNLFLSLLKLIKQKNIKNQLKMF